MYTNCHRKNNTIPVNVYMHIKSYLNAVHILGLASYLDLELATFLIVVVV